MGVDVFAAGMGAKPGCYVAAASWRMGAAAIKSIRRELTSNVQASS